MDITKLNISNFLTIGKAEIELDGRGLLLLQGENADDTSAKSNGAGKSTIADALCWAIFGVTARGVGGDAVVNKTAKKNCCVKVFLSDGASRYSIHRFRKDSLEKNQLFVYQTDDAGASSDLSKGTERETQETIGRILGCSLDVFQAAVYFGQEKTPDLPGSTDKQLKLLVEEAAGVSELSEAYAEARQRSVKAEAEAFAALTSGAALKALEESAKTALENCEVDERIFEDERKSRALSELAAIKPLEEQKKVIRLNIEALDEPALKTGKGAIEAALAAHRGQQSALAALSGLERSAGDAAGKVRAAVTQQKARLTEIDVALSNLASQVGVGCGECGKTYCEHDLEAARQLRLEARDKAVATLREGATLYKATLAEHKLRQQEVADFVLTDVSAVSARLAGINRDLMGLNSLTAGVTRIDGEIVTIKAAAKLRLTEANPWTKAVESRREQVKVLSAQIVEHAARVASLEAKADLYGDAVRVFGPAGVRAHILDTVTPFLNERTGDYLNALADGNIRASWNTLTKTAKGELKEKFNIDVTNDQGAESFAGLSGGEKRKVRLATAMALQDMVASRASKPVGLFIADEIDEALDEAGLERLMGVLEKKARERGTVLVISHNSLSDWISEVVTVAKSGGLATVSGATHRGF